jgi:hypothetical protein
MTGRRGKLPLSYEERIRIVEEYEKNGKDIYKIMGELRHSRSTIVKYLRLNGIEPRHIIHTSQIEYPNIISLRMRIENSIMNFKYRGDISPYERLKEFGCYLIININRGRDGEDAIRYVHKYYTPPGLARKINDLSENANRLSKEYSQSGRKKRLYHLVDWIWGITIDSDLS